HHGFVGYSQYVVRRAYTPGGGNVDGIAELRFASRAEFDERYYRSDAGRRAIRADVAEFIDLENTNATLMRALPLRELQ
ncbi:MAG TPA: hypothetical protein VFR41_16470, partial [Acidimicrobiia bacterium]|nr:hypothetical protein [Acidimicrobiia bacterium]